MTDTAQTVVNDIKDAQPEVQAVGTVVGMATGNPEIPAIIDAAIPIALALAEVYKQISAKNQPVPTLEQQQALGVSLGSALKAYNAAK
jgi:hypothetical protein